MLHRIDPSPTSDRQDPNPQIGQKSARSTLAGLGSTVGQRLERWAKLEMIGDPIERRLTRPLVPFLVAIVVLGACASVTFALLTDDLAGTALLIAGPAAAALGALAGLVLLTQGEHRSAASVGTWSITVAAAAQVIHYGHPSSQFLLITFLIPITASALFGRTAMALSQATVAIAIAGVVTLVGNQGLLTPFIGPPGLAPEIAAWPTFALASAAFVVIVTTIAAELRDSVRATLGETVAASANRRALEEEIARSRRANSNLVERREELEAITTMAELLLASRDEREARVVIEDLLHRLFSSGVCRLLTIEHGIATLRASSRREIDGTPAFAASACWAIRRGRTHHSGVAQSSVACKHIDDGDAKTENLCVPMTADGEASAILWWQGEGLSTVDRKREHRRLRIVSEQLGLALANLELRERLRQLAIRDSLTGLFNRRFFDETLEIEVRRSMRDGQDLALLMIDIDRFKRINDSHGHEAGDEALRIVASTLQWRIRESDIICRLGGEEFAVVLPGASLKVAETRAEELREAIEQASMHFDGRSLGNVTISIGAAAHGGPTAGREEFLRAADGALYRAKVGGRNRVVLADPTLSGALPS